MPDVPEYTSVARISFDSVHAAADAVIQILRRGVQLGAVELPPQDGNARLNSSRINSPSRTSSSATP